MKFKKQRDEEERLERAAKIKAHMSKALPAKADSKADDQAKPKAVPCAIYPPLQPWERLGAFGRREQYRPLTSREVDQENDRLFMESQQRQDAAHAKKIEAAELDQKAEQRRNDKQHEHESRTGKRPYEPGRYVSLEEARRRGFLGSGTAEGSNGNEWSSPGNPHGLMCGGRR